ISAGDTADEALDNAAEALGLHMRGMRTDGIDAPVARSIEEIRNDPSLAEDRKGAVLGYVSAIEDMGSSKRLNISLDRGLIEAIDNEANRRKMTRSAFIASAARHEIGGG
ncbi:MAG TPA: ribbon-helix-helix protein, CopG family, partial [Rhizobiales bacterium]|nr:ribbon-helix-helix protein, CopG family [Hyphomicrobiales bacterium]